MNKTTSPILGSTLAGVLALIVTTNAPAAVTMSNFGATAPVLNPVTDTGFTNLAGISGESRLRGGNSTGQTFQLTNAGTAESVYLAYAGFGFDQLDGDVDFTFRLDVNNDGSYEVTQSFVDFDVTGFYTGVFPVYHWLEFDLSAENITLAAATTHSFTVTNDEPLNGNRSIWTQPYFGTNVYPNGASLGQGSDLPFAVTTVPEPTSTLLFFGSGLLLLARRRRASAH